MAQNYNLNSSFGLNITGGANRTSSQIQVESLAEKASSLFDSMTSYVDKYENVFSGDVEKEINMYSRQAMIIGMNLKASDNTVRRFDTNI